MKILPGLPTLSALMLAAVLTAWLGIWGPINLSALEKWQTLMTGFVALIAAGIAYRGATANVRHGREIVANENRRRTLSLYLKTEFALRQVRERARKVSASVEFQPIEGDQYFRASDLAVPEPADLKEAWDFLDLLPRQMIAEIWNVRNCLRELAIVVADELGEDAVAWGPTDKKPHKVISEAQALTNGIYNSAAIALDILTPLIRQLAPEMPQSERMLRIYGEPDFDD